MLAVTLHSRHYVYPCFGDEDLYDESVQKFVQDDIAGSEKNREMNRGY